MAYHVHTTMQYTSVTVKAAVREALGALFTLFLFTKSDIKTTLIPIVGAYYSQSRGLCTKACMLQAIGGAVAAPVWSFRNFVEEFLWIWLHLLQFTTSNQSCTLTAVAEDSDNKPDRPIPSGRMTLRQTRFLRWLLVPVCLAVSCHYSSSVLAASVGVIAITIWYNEFSGSGDHWFIRNLLNGIGFGAFQTGATLLAGTFCVPIPMQRQHLTDAKAMIVPSSMW